MQASATIHSIPLWALYLVTAGIALLAVEIGFQMGNRRRQYAPHEKDAPIGPAIGATLGLLAFLMAFTFGAAATRFDTRKQLVVQESNAIGTAYLRTAILAEPQRAEARDILTQYARLRVEGVISIAKPEIVAQSAALQDRLWGIASAASNAHPESVANGLFMQSVNDMIDLDTVRTTAGRNVIPETIWWNLYVITTLTMIALGYQFGLSGSRSVRETLLLVMTFTAVILLIADLDRPQGGLVRVSQQAMIDLLNRIGGAVP